MARRKNSRKPRRKSAKAINILGVAESGLLLNAITTNLFGANLGDFVMGTQNGKYNPGSDGSTRLTIPEMFGAGPGGVGGNYAGTGGMTSSVQSVTDVVVWNLKKNAMPLIGSLVMIPLAFKVGSKLTSKPRSTVNRGLKMSGLGVKV